MDFIRMGILRSHACCAVQPNRVGKNIEQRVERIAGIYFHVDAGSRAVCACGGMRCATTWGVGWCASVDTGGDRAPGPSRRWAETIGLVPRGRGRGEAG